MSRTCATSRIASRRIPICLRAAVQGARRSVAVKRAREASECRRHKSGNGRLGPDQRVDDFKSTRPVIASVNRSNPENVGSHTTFELLRRPKAGSQLAMTARFDLIAILLWWLNLNAWYPTGDVANGREARLQGSPREGPECAPQPPFRARNRAHRPQAETSEARPSPRFCATLASLAARGAADRPARDHLRGQGV